MSNLNSTDKKFQVIVGSLRDFGVDKNDPDVEVISKGSDGYKVSLFNQDVLEIIRTLKKGGYEVKALCKGEYEDELGWFPWSPAFEKNARSIGAIIESISVPGGVGLMLVAGNNPVFNWLHNASERPRDAFLQLDGIVYLNSYYYPKKSVSQKDHGGYISRMRWLIPEGLRRINEVEKEDREQRDKSPDYKDKEKWKQYMEECRKIWRKKEAVEKKVDEELGSALVPNAFGESGRVIVFKDFVIASYEIKKKLKTSEGYEFQGKKVYFVKPVESNIGDRRVLPQDIRFHIDYHVNGMDLDDHAFVYMDSGFYQKNQGVLKMVEREQKVEFDFVPKNERSVIPCNFLVLPDRKVLIPKEIPETQERLELKLGRDNVLTTDKSLPNLLREGYGIRCVTNVIC